MEGRVAELPRPKRGRVRRSQSMEAAGELTLSIIAREGGEAPANVVRVFPKPDPTPVTQSPELALLIAIFSALNDEQKTKVRGQLRYAASAVKCPHLAGACALVALRDTD